MLTEEPQRLPLNQRNGTRRRVKRQSERRALTRMVLRVIAERPGEWLTHEDVGRMLNVDKWEALLSLLGLQRRGHAEGSIADMRYRVTAQGTKRAPEED